MMRFLSKREMLILAVCLLVVLIGGGLKFAYQPLSAYNEKLQGKVLVSEKRLKNYSRLLHMEPAVNKEYEMYASYFEQKLSDAQEMAGILSEIESAANQAGLRIEDIKPERVKKVDFYNNFSATLTLEGNLETILRFLYTLQNIPHLFRIAEIRLEPYSIREAQLLRCYVLLNKTLFPSL